MSVQHRTKHQPFRILCLLLYGSHGFTAWDGDQVTVRAGGLSRILRVSRGRIRDYFKWLQDCGYISGLEETAGRETRYTFTVNRPKRWEAQA